MTHLEPATLITAPWDSCVWDAMPFQKLGSFWKFLGPEMSRGLWICVVIWQTDSQCTFCVFSPKNLKNSVFWFRGNKMFHKHPMSPWISCPSLWLWPAWKFWTRHNCFSVCAKVNTGGSRFNRIWIFQIPGLLEVLWKPYSCVSFLFFCPLHSKFAFY